jgi:hypothetical protein
MTMVSPSASPLNGDLAAAFGADSGSASDGGIGPVDSGAGVWVTMCAL